MRRTRVSFTHILTAALILITSTAWAQVQYKVIPVTSPFNPSDTVIGNAVSKSGVLPLNDIKNGPEQAFEWRSRKGIPLTLFGGQCSTANGINAANHITGGACPSGDSSSHAYLYKKSGTLDLGTFGGVSAFGYGVNRRDQVTGSYILSDGTYGSFFWTKKGWSDLGGLGGSFTYAYRVNDSAVVTGQSDISNTPDPVFGIPPFHGFQWAGGVLTDFGSIFGSNFNYGSAINNAGVIAGAADVAGDLGAHAILWTGGTVQDLTPGDNITAWTADINNVGQVVGAWGSVDPDPADGPPVYSMLCPCNATLWQNGGVTFLSEVVPPGWNLLLALAISDKGEILARGQFNGGHSELVLLKPLPSTGTKATTFRKTVTPPSRSLDTNAPRKIQRLLQGGYREIR